MQLMAEGASVKQHILDTGRRMMAHKGFTAVGLNELLKEAGVPKGSFYYYFHSKEAFGEAMLESYFTTYLLQLDRTLKQEGRLAGECLSSYWENWVESQSSGCVEGHCLVVKLGAEVSDLSEAMRLRLEQGTRQTVQRIAQCMQEGMEDGSLPKHPDALQMAEILYELWLGATLLTKMERGRHSLEVAFAFTRQLLYPQSL